MERINWIVLTFIASIITAISTYCTTIKFQALLLYFGFNVPFNSVLGLIAASNLVWLIPVAIAVYFRIRFK